MAAKHRPVTDPYPIFITGEQLRQEFAERWADGKRRGELLSLPEQCLRSKKASWRDKLDAWGKIVNRLGMDEKQRVEHSGSLRASDMSDDELRERAARLLGVQVEPKA